MLESLMIYVPAYQANPGHINLKSNKLNVFLGTYPMQTGNWYFFAIVLDGVLNKGSLQIDYSYGFSNGSIDFKVTTLTSKKIAKTLTSYTRI